MRSARILCVTILAAALAGGGVFAQADPYLTDEDIEAYEMNIPGFDIIIIPIQPAPAPEPEPPAPEPEPPLIAQPEPAPAPPPPEPAPAPPPPEPTPAPPPPEPAPAPPPPEPAPPPPPPPASGDQDLYHLVVLNADGRFTFPDTIPTLFMWTHKKFGYPDGYTVVLFKSPRLLTEADFAGQAELLLYVASEWKSAIRQEISGNGAFTQFITNTTIRRMLLELLR